jgi:hypothetical protein
MTHDRSRNSNNGDDNNIKNPSSSLEHLLIVQAQLLQVVQHILVQMQDANQLMQSMEVRSSSRKRKSDTQDDVGQAQKINAIKKATPNHKEGSMLAKATTTCSLSISSTPALPKAKDEICDANDHGHNNAMNPPPLD